MNGQRWILVGAAFLFLLSGFSALVYQVAWQRILGVFSGMHIYSITIIVTAFMAGLGFGSFFSGRYADRLKSSRAMTYFALCELTIALFALVSPWLYYDIAYEKLGYLVRYSLLLPSIHLILLIVPTFLMGASLPLLSRGLVVGRAVGAAKTIGVLYGVNTLGAALGAFTTVWYLIGSMGFPGAIRVGALLNFIAAVGALVLRNALLRREKGASAFTDAAPASEPRSTGDSSGAGALSFKHWALLYALSGFLALSLEIVWFRVLDVMIKSSPYTFGHLLGTFLLFLALGSLVGTRVVQRGKRPDLVFFWAQWGVTAFSALSIVALCRMPLGNSMMGELYRYWTSDAGIVLSQLAGALQENNPQSDWLIRIAWRIWIFLPIFLLGIPTFLMGLSFAYIQRAIQTDITQVGWRVGAIQTANIVGSILGSLLTGTLLLEWLGTPATLKLLTAVGLTFGLFAVLRGREKFLAVKLAIVLVLQAGLIFAIPSETPFWARFHGSRESDVIVAEDASSIVALHRFKQNRAVLRVNGTGHSVIPYGGPHTLLGSLPMLVHPEPKDVLIIGLGAGNTAWAASSAPALERLDLYEIAEPEFDVLKQFEGRWFDFPAIQSVLEDPRIHIRFSDGRLALRTEPRKYDVIEADALEPYMAYSGNLYSQEFFESARDSLKPGGMVVSYTPSERTRRTFVSAFPYVVHAYSPRYLSFMIGSNEPIPYDESVILDRVQNPKFLAHFEASGFAAQVVHDVQTFVKDSEPLRIDSTNREELMKGEKNTDLFPRDEFDKKTLLEG